MANTYLQRTCSTTSSITNATISFWIKRNKLGSAQTVFAGNYTVNNNYSCRVRFTGSDELNFYNYDNATNCQYVTNRKFRDTSAWYHIVFELDQTQATAADRVKIYVNGVQETSFSTETTMSGDQWLLGKNSSYENVLGQVQSTDYLDADLAHFHYCEGYTYDADEFGQTETSSGIWKPKVAPSVTYGTNGFFLKFQDSSSLGDDSSGNTNDLTLSGSGTQTLDTPSNVFCTMNPLQTNSNVTLSNGNLTGSSVYDTDNVSSWGTLAVTTGKWYWEVKYRTGNYQSTAYIVGIGRKSGTRASVGYRVSGTSDKGIALNLSGNYQSNGSTPASYFGSSISVGDIIGVALDATNNQVKFNVNGGTFGSDLTFNSDADADIYVPSSDFYALSGTPVTDFNFGNGYFGTTAVASANSDSAGIGKFEYSVPSGYYALCTKNIAEYG